jgi:hypothetical protein
MFIKRKRIEMKIKNYLKLLPILIMAVYAAGCTTSYYVPNTLHTPFFDDSNELHVSGYYASSGWNINSAYSITDFIGVIGGINYFPLNENAGEKRFLGEAGAVYFVNFENLVVIPNFLAFNRLQFLGGLGKGDTRGNFNIIPGFTNVTGEFNKYFLQVNLAASTDQDVKRKQGTSSSQFYFDFGTALRYSYLDFTKFYNGAVTLNENVDENLFELITFLKLGFSWARLELQLGRVFETTGNIPISPTYFSIGTYFIFSL